MKNYKAIAIKCDKEQFEAIKPKLKGKIINCVSINGFDEYNYLVNCDGNADHISNVSRDDFNHVWEKVEAIHEQWNEKIFLEACGIETEPTYKINKETIIKYNMKDEFPDVFEVKLEVGKWYKRTHGKALFKVLSSPDEDGKFEVSGFDVRGFWMEDEKCYTFLCGEIEATPQEVETALKNEAVKRYKAGDYLKNFEGYFNGLENNMVLGGNNFYIDSDGSFCVMSTNNYWIKLMNNKGIWASVIPTKTIKEAEELLNCKIV